MPLSLEVSFSSGKRYHFEVPLAQLPDKPVFGYFSFSVENDQLILGIFENKGVTRVTLHVGKVWAMEPSRRLAVFSLAP